MIEFTLVEHARVVPEGPVAQRAQARPEQLAEVGPLGQGDAVERLGGGLDGLPRLFSGTGVGVHAAGSGSGAQYGACLQKTSAIHLHHVSLRQRIQAV